MIAMLKGQVAAIALETAIIDVNGVGYEINTTPRLLQSLNAGEAVSLAIETVVREDFIRLYGFATQSEKQCFRILQSVQGVGAKHALNILQVLPPHDLYEAIAAEDVTAVSQAHGVGKKIAQRITTELQSKLASLAGEVGSGLALSARDKATEQGGNSEARTDRSGQSGLVKADAVSALVNLGYDSTEARRAVNSAALVLDNPSVESIIPLALKELA